MLATGTFCLGFGMTMGVGAPLDEASTEDAGLFLAADRGEAGLEGVET
jgi:hypothetical protein